MSDIRIWIETSHNAAFRSGGWAYVLAEGSARSGAAGGERTASTERIGLVGLVAATKDLPVGANIEILSSNRLILAALRRITAFEGGVETPAEHLELWAQLATALKARGARLSTVENQPRTPTAFATAWAELARDKAKTAGTFASVIPKANLAKLGAA